MIGKLLDRRYQIIRILAAGGFGETYIAQDTRRPGNPICVVKHLKPTSSDPQVFITAKRLFQSEAETLEKLGNHPQIPRLLAYFDENQEFFLVQEYIDGHTLADEIIHGQPWSQEQVIQMLLEILSILEFVHQQGVIHRDIKPDNIIRRTSDYKLVLVDFGAVKQLHTSLATVGKQSTATVAIGTPGYMPTEQAQGKPRPNSDIYSLGIIAIQAITGISVNQLQEDSNTGEILWQNPIPIDYRLASILSQMVRYYFKDRYQTAAEVIQAIHKLVNIPATSAVSSSSQQGVNLQRRYPLTQSLVQRTVAVAPANNLPNNTKKINRDTHKYDPLPLLICLFLVSSVAVLVTNIYPSVKNFAAALTGNNLQSQGKTCSVMVEANSNIRSEPSSINSDNILKTLGEETAFPVTGKRTKRGWVEVKLRSGRMAWAHSDVISNKEQWVSCLRDQEISIQTVDDNSLISTRPIPKLLPKPDIASSSPPPPQKGKAVEEARQKLESGDLQGALATLKAIPKKAVSGIAEGVEMTNEWQQDWHKAEAAANDINHDIDRGQWDKVLAYRSHPEKLPNIKYWRQKLEPLFKQAEENMGKELKAKMEQGSGGAGEQGSRGAGGGGKN